MGDPESGGPGNGIPVNGRLRKCAAQIVRGAGRFSDHQIKIWMENEHERG